MAEVEAVLADAGPRDGDRIFGTFATPTSAGAVATAYDAAGAVLHSHPVT